MNKKNHKKGTIENNNPKKSVDDIGLDPDEQAMNGLYGMAETECEDSLPDSQK